MGGGGGLTQIAAAVVGGVVGFVTGGPAGALRGAAIGYTLFAKKPQPPAAGSVVDTPDTGQLATAIGENAWVPKAYGNRRGGVVLIATDVMTETTEEGFGYKIVGENESGGYATSVYALGEGPWNKINNLIYNNNKLFKDDANIEFNTRYGFGHNIWSEVQDYSNMEVYFARGDRDQTVPTILSEVRLAEVEEDGNLNWFRPTDTGSGICYMVLRIKRDKDAIIRETAPNLIIDAETKLVPEIRQEGSPLVYSTNPSLIALDQLRGIYDSNNVRQNIFSFGVTDQELDFDSFVNFANYCDDPNEYDGQAAFEINGQFRQGSTIKDILEDISLATGAIFEDQNGIIRVQTDKSQLTNTGISITQDNIIGNITRTEPKTSEVPNVMNVKFRNQEGNEVIEVVSFSDALIEREGRKEADLDLRMVQSTAQAREMGKRALYLNRASTFDFELDITGYNLDVHNVCDISDILDQDIVADESRIRILNVTKQRISTDTTGRRAPVRVSAKLYNEQVYSVDPNNSDDISVIPDNSVFSDAPSQTFIPLPTGVTVSRLTDTTAIVSWDSQPEYTAQIQIRSTDSGEIFRTKASVVSDDRADIDFINAGTYDVGVRYIDPSTGSTGSRSVVTYITNGIQTNLSDNGVTIIDGQFGAFQYKYGEFAFASNENGDGIRSRYTAANEIQEITSNQPYDSPTTATVAYNLEGARRHSITLTVPDNFNAGSETNETYRFPFNPLERGGGVTFSDPENYSTDYLVPSTQAFPQWDGSKWVQYFSYVETMNGTEYTIQEKPVGVDGATFSNVARFTQATATEIAGSRIADRLTTSFYNTFNGRSKPYEMYHNREENRLELQFILEADFNGWEFQLTQVGGDAGDWSQGSQNGQAGSNGGYQYFFSDGNPNPSGGSASGDQQNDMSGDNENGSLPSIPAQEDLENIGNIQDLNWTYSNGSFTASVWDELFNGNEAPGTGRNATEALIDQGVRRGAIYLGNNITDGGNLVVQYQPASWTGTIREGSGSVSFTAGPLPYWNGTTGSNPTGDWRVLPELTNGQVYFFGPGTAELISFERGFFTGVPEDRGVGFMNTGSGTLYFTQGTSGSSDSLTTYPADPSGSQRILVGTPASAGNDPVTTTEGGGLITYYYPDTAGDRDSFNERDARITLADGTITTLPSNDLYLWTERFVGEETFGSVINTPIEPIILGPQDPNQTDSERVFEELEALASVAVNQRTAIGGGDVSSTIGGSFQGDPNLPTLDGFIGQPFARIDWSNPPRSGFASSFIPSGDIGANYNAFDTSVSDTSVGTGPNRTFIEAGTPIQPFVLQADLDTTINDKISTGLNTSTNDGGFETTVPFIAEIEQRFNIDPADTNYNSARKYLIWLADELTSRYPELTTTITSGFAGSWNLNIDYGNNEPFGLSNIGWSRYNLINSSNQNLQQNITDNYPDYITVSPATFGQIQFPDGGDSIFGITANQNVSPDGNDPIYEPIPFATGEQFATTYARVINDADDINWTASVTDIDADTAEAVNDPNMTRMLVITRSITGNANGALQFETFGENDSALGFQEFRTSHYLPKSLEVEIGQTDNAIRNRWTELSVARTAFTDDANQNQAITDFETALGTYYSENKYQKGFEIIKTRYDNLQKLEFTLDGIDWSFEEITDGEIPPYIITDQTEFNQRYGVSVGKNRTSPNSSGYFIEDNIGNLSLGNSNTIGTFSYPSFTIDGTDQAITFTTDVSNIEAGDYANNILGNQVISVDTVNNTLTFDANIIPTLFNEAGGSLTLHRSVSQLGVFKATVNNIDYYLYKRAPSSATPSMLLSTESQLGWVITSAGSANPWYWFVDDKSSYAIVNDSDASQLEFSDLETAKVIKLGTGVSYNEINADDLNSSNLSVSNWTYTTGATAVPYSKVDYVWTVNDTIPMTITFNPNFNNNDEEITNRRNVLKDNIELKVNNGIVPKINYGGTRYLPTKDEIIITEGSSRTQIFNDRFWNYAYDNNANGLFITNVDTNTNTITVRYTSITLNYLAPKVPLYIEGTDVTAAASIIESIGNEGANNTIELIMKTLPAEFIVGANLLLNNAYAGQQVRGHRYPPEGHINSIFETLTYEFNETNSGYTSEITSDPLLRITKTNNSYSDGYYEWSVANVLPNNTTGYIGPYNVSGIVDQSSEFGIQNAHTEITDYNGNFDALMGDVSYIYTGFATDRFTIDWEYDGVPIDMDASYRINLKQNETSFEIDSINGQVITFTEPFVFFELGTGTAGGEWKGYLSDTKGAATTAESWFTITAVDSAAGQVTLSETIPASWGAGTKLYRKTVLDFQPGNIDMNLTTNNRWTFTLSGVTFTSGAPQTSETSVFHTANVSGNNILNVATTPSAGDTSIHTITGFGSFANLYFWGYLDTVGDNNWIWLIGTNGDSDSNPVIYRYKGTSVSYLNSSDYYVNIDTNETPITQEQIDALTAKSFIRWSMNNADVSASVGKSFVSPFLLTQNGGDIPTHFGARSRRTVEELTDDYSQFQGVSIPGNRPENNDDYDTWKDSFTWFELDRETAPAITPAYRVIVRRAPDLDWATNPIDTGNGFRSLETSTLNAGSGVNKQFIINADAGTVVNPDDLTTYIDRPNGIATGSIRIYDATNTRYVLAIQVNSSDDIPTTLVEGNTIYLDTTSGVTLAGITTPTKGAFYSYRATEAEWIVTPVE